jgi:hypothetical protein
MLNFPNPCRVHDASRHCVCFWGYDDSAREICLPDRNLDRIGGLARTLYKDGPQNRYTIT